MSGNGEPVQRPWKRGLNYLLSVLCVVGFLVVLWHGYGSGRRVSRESDLAIVQKEVFWDYAKIHGRYPASLSEAFEWANAEDLLARVGADSLVYVAAREAFSEHPGERILFYERRATRYGFTRGWVEVRQGWSVRFHEGDPPVGLVHEYSD